jgi:hypothetical protein
MVRALGGTDPQAPYWADMALQMFQNAFALHDLLEQMIANRNTTDGFPAVFVSAGRVCADEIFALYMCGDIAHSLSRWPMLNPSNVHRSGPMLQASIRVLEQLEDVWPLATHWRVTLTQLVFQAGDNASLNAVAPHVSPRECFENNAD